MNILLIYLLLINLIKLKKRFSALIALERKQAKLKKTSQEDREKIDGKIKELIIKRSEIEKQISIFSTLLLEKQVAQISSVDINAISAITKEETNAASTETLFQDNLDEFLKKVIKK